MKNITETNKLIAEFMGHKYFPDNHETFEHFIIDNRVMLLDKLKYHSSWDYWLMPVVEKIYSLNKGDWTYIASSFLPDNLNIEATYNAVISFINWYNENK